MIFSSYHSCVILYLRCNEFTRKFSCRSAILCQSPRNYLAQLTSFKLVHRIRPCGSLRVVSRLCRTYRVSKWLPFFLINALPGDRTHFWTLIRENQRYFTSSTNFCTKFMSARVKRCIDEISHICRGIFIILKRMLWQMVDKHLILRIALYRDRTKDKLESFKKLLTIEIFKTFLR